MCPWANHLRLRASVALRNEVSWGYSNKLPRTEWLKATGIYSPPVLKVSGLKLGCQRDRAPSDTSWGDPFSPPPAPGGCARALACLGLQAPRSNLCLHRHMPFSLCVCSPRLIFLWRLQPPDSISRSPFPEWPYINVMMSARSLFKNKVRTQLLLWGDRILPTMHGVGCLTSKMPGAGSQLAQPGRGREGSVHSCQYWGLGDGPVETPRMPSEVWGRPGLGCDLGAPQSRNWDWPWLWMFKLPHNCGHLTH